MSSKATAASVACARSLAANTDEQTGQVINRAILSKGEFRLLRLSARFPADLGGTILLQPTCSGATQEWWKGKRRDSQRQGSASPGSSGDLPVPILVHVSHCVFCKEAGVFFCVIRGSVVIPRLYPRHVTLPPVALVCTTAIRHKAQQRVQQSMSNSLRQRPPSATSSAPVGHAGTSTSGGGSTSTRTSVNVSREALADAIHDPAPRLEPYHRLFGALLFLTV